LELPREEADYESSALGAAPVHGQGRWRLRAASPTESPSRASAPRPSSRDAAVGAIVHDSLEPQEAFDQYLRERR